MTFKNVMTVGLFAAVLTTVGCGEKNDKSSAVTKRTVPPTQDTGKKDDNHGHGKGPNGGVLFDLGKYHGEFTVDHGKKECTVLVIGDDEKTPKSVAAKELTVTTKESKTKDGKVVPPMTIKLLPTDAKDGKATKFVGTDPGLGNVADFEGTVIGEIDGKPSKGEFKEE